MSDHVELAADFFKDAALTAPVWAVVKLAEVIAEAYERIENPNGGRSTDAVLEWFPKIEAALQDAGLRP